LRKIRSNFKKTENNFGVLVFSDAEIRIPRSELADFKIGDEVVITISSPEVDLENSDEVARALLREVFREEKS